MEEDKGREEMEEEREEEGLSSFGSHRTQAVGNNNTFTVLFSLHHSIKR